MTLRAAIEAMRKLAKEATNGWACYAKRDMEHREIARLHTAIDELTAALAQPDAGEGCCRCGKVACVGATMEVGPFCCECWEPIKARAVEVQRINDAVEATPADTPPPSPQPSLTQEELLEVASVMEGYAEDVPLGADEARVRALVAKCRAYAEPETGR